MRKIFIFLVSIVLLGGCKKEFVSPDNKIAVAADWVNPDSPLKVYYDGKYVMSIAHPGISVNDTVLPCRDVNILKKKLGCEEKYTMLAGKKKQCYNNYNEYSFEFNPIDSDTLGMCLRVYNDGIAFRYVLNTADSVKVSGETTSYSIPDGVDRWMQSYDPESYERFYDFGNKRGDTGQEYAYPALFNFAPDVWGLVSEAGMHRYNSASYLSSDSLVDGYKVNAARNNKTISGEWSSPWRVIMLGDLSDVVESTLIADVSDAPAVGDYSWVQPGVVSWIYWAHNHGSNDYNIIKQYVDMAKTLKLPYVLIDAEWDEMKDGKTIDDAIEYSLSNGVKPLLWYNSSCGWVNGAPGPKFRLNDPDDREKEFAWLEEKGVAGVKIDFFGGDGQPIIEYYIDLLEAAARHNLLVNFHGATLPRGWQRTYPNLMTVEGVYGAEWYNNSSVLTDKAASHNATLPFTRNVVGPMDYTPCTFSDSQHPHITTHGHELALTVLYESALQHLADRPESYLAQPQEVQDFFSELSSVWDDTKLLGGYPGDYVVMAREKDGRLYIAGINGNDTAKVVAPDLKRLNLKGGKRYTLYTDSETDSSQWSITTIDTVPTQLNLAPRGGFVIVENKN